MIRDRGNRSMDGRLLGKEESGLFQPERTNSESRGGSITRQER